MKTFDEIMEAAFNQAGELGREILTGASEGVSAHEVFGSLASSTDEQYRRYVRAHISSVDHAIEAIERARKAKREFVRAFTPNRHGEYA